MTRLLSIAAVLAALHMPARAATPGTEFVLVLDNSASLIEGSTLETKQADGSVTKETLPATDPDRLAVLATLLLRGILDPQDKLTILTFKAPGEFEVLPNDITQIREVRQYTGTWFSGPLKEAQRILAASDRSRRVLFLMTDGAPSSDDALDGKQARALLKLDEAPGAFDVISVALSAGDSSLESQQKAFLGPLGEYIPVKTPIELVEQFTAAYARTLRSRPESGSLKPSSSFAFDVPQYVSEVMVFVAGQTRTGPFTTKLETDRGAAVAKEQNDNGCSYCKPVNGQHGCFMRKEEPNRYMPMENKRMCLPPFNAYQIYKEAHDPERKSRWTLSLPDARGPVQYGIILRYDLVAEVMQSPTGVHVGEEVEVRARLTFKGKTFDDKKFFEADGFKATAVLGDQVGALQLQSDNTFKGKVVADKEGRIPLTIRFENRWLDLKASAPDVKVEGWIPLSFKVNPALVDFGSWTGSDALATRCVTLDLTGSEGIDKVPFEFVGQNLPAKLMLAGQQDGDAAEVVPGKLDGNKVTLCLATPGCCDAAEIAPGGEPKILVRGTNPHYHPEAVPLAVKASLAKTPFLVCWWKVIATVLGLIAGGIVVYGLVSPADFDREEVIRMAKNETALARAVARRLNELPGGRRGFYRHARVGFDGTGNAVTDVKGALLAMTAKKGDPLVVVRGTLEKKDPRTRAWVAVPGNEVADAVRRGQVYRIGEFYFRLG